MSKRNKIIYWVATLWASLGMICTAIVQLLQLHQKSYDFIFHLGYPAYFITMLGVCKILGVIAILIPRAPLVKEWAYAGFFFIMIGAIVSHLAVGDPIGDLLRAFFLLALVFVSWYFRPQDRKFANA